MNTIARKHIAISIIIPVIHLMFGFGEAYGQIEKIKPLALEIKHPYVAVEFIDGIPTMGAFIKVRDGDVRELLSHGVKVGARIGDMVTATVPLSTMSAVSKLNSVISVAPAYPVELDLNISDGVVRASEARGAFGKDGEGIIIGVVDIGIEGVLELLQSNKNQDQEWIDGDLVQSEILDYLGVPLGSLMLKHYRESKGISQDVIARILGTSRQYINKLETGSENINLKMSEKLAKFFSVSAETFLKR